MIIGVDASRAAKKYLTGTEYYSREIIKNIYQLDSINQYILYTSNPLGGDLANLPPNFKIKIMKFPKLWSQIRLAFELLKNPPDILFEPAHTIPIITRCKAVVTLHDVGFRQFPLLYSPFERFYHDFSMRSSVKKSSHIIVPSQYSKKDVIKFYGVSPSKISVIYHGYDRETYNTGKAGLKNKYQEKFGKYIYFVGRLEEKKNIWRMIRAFGLLKRNPQIQHKFLISGRTGYRTDKIKSEIENLPPNVKKDVILLGYSSKEEVAELLRGADIFLFTTLFEGFGMPVIEAQACGTSVLASNTTSLPEISENSALLVNPNKEEQIASGLYKIITTPALKRSLIAKGLKNVRRFSWKKAAEETLDVIYKAAQK